VGPKLVVFGLHFPVVGLIWNIGTKREAQFQTFWQTEPGT